MEFAISYWEVFYIAYLSIWIQASSFFRLWFCILLINGFYCINVIFYVVLSGISVILVLFNVLIFYIFIGSLFKN